MELKTKVSRFFQGILGKLYFQESGQPAEPQRHIIAVLSENYSPFVAFPPIAAMLEIATNGISNLRH